MVHNGIEYGDMQVIAEAYDLMRRGMGMGPMEMSKVFATWDEGRLHSYLIEITSEILTRELDGQPVVDVILDAAGQKGTGKWTVVSSLDLGQPTTLVAEAVYARIVSSDPDARKRVATIYPDSPATLEAVTPDDVESASDEFDWGLDLGTIASIWRAGCIIRAAFLEDITAAFLRDPGLTDMMEDNFFSQALVEATTSWREVVARAALSGIPAPAYASALSYFDGMRSERLPANLIQAQRDFFGAHTFERVDGQRGEFFHHEW
jgi:6-phosphogluconate dehydrogenase